MSCTVFDSLFTCPTLLQAVTKQPVVVFWNINNAITYASDPFDYDFINYEGGVYMGLVCINGPFLLGQYYHMM